ncbi:hypothetical protein OROGR_021685 [Orobanche gracilis]
MYIDRKESHRWNVQRVRMTSSQMKMMNLFIFVMFLFLLYLYKIPLRIENQGVIGYTFRSLDPENCQFYGPGSGPVRDFESPNPEIGRYINPSLGL